MAKRTHLHDLTRQIRRYLEHQVADGVHTYVPATDEERAEFDARQQARQEAQLADLRSQITGEPAQQPGTSQTEEMSSPGAKPPSSFQQDQQEKPNRSDSQSSSGPKKSAVTADTPLWKKHDAIHQLQAEKQAKAKKASQARRRSPKPGASASTPPPEMSQQNAPPKNPKTPEEKMAFLRHYLGNCQRCPLHEGRTNVVFGSGDPQARLMFVGEGPGAPEDQQGLPFVGKSGKLLTEMIDAMGLSRDEVYITNIVKCRPPDHRDPAPLEVRECAPFLKKQIEVVDPEVIVTLGRPAANTLLGTEDEPLGKLRARWHEHRGVAVMPTYHPSDLLRTEPDKKLKKRAWEDLQKVMGRLDLK